MHFTESWKCFLVHISTYPFWIQLCLNPAKIGSCISQFSKGIPEDKEKFSPLQLAMYYSKHRVYRRPAWALGGQGGKLQRMSQINEQRSKKKWKEKSFKEMYIFCHQGQTVTGFLNRSKTTLMGRIRQESMVKSRLTHEVSPNRLLQTWGWDSIEGAQQQLLIFKKRVCRVSLQVSLIVVHPLEQGELLKETLMKIKDRAERGWIGHWIFFGKIPVTSPALHVDLTSSNLYRSRIRTKIINEPPLSRTGLGSTLPQRRWKVLLVRWSPTLQATWCVLSHFSHAWLSATPWTIACQAPLSKGFSRQEYWSGLPCPPVPTQGLNPHL